MHVFKKCEKPPGILNVHMVWSLAIMIDLGIKHLWGALFGFISNSVLFTSCSVMEKKTSMKLLTSGAGLPLYVLRKLIFFCNIS
ncbi:unnamed protein product [Schistosoma guineensis]|nr:unnamed protein product [Schistosoma guineensis]